MSKMTNKVKERLKDLEKSEVRREIEGKRVTKLVSREKNEL